MTFAIGGTAKVRRIVREKPTPWTHTCRRPVTILGTLEQPTRIEVRDVEAGLTADYVRCPDCGTKRP